MKKNTYYLLIGALLTGCVIILAQLRITLPSMVPITLQTLGIYLIGLLLKPKYAFLSALSYIILGLVLPVFSGFQSASALLSPAGGFLMTFPVMALFISWYIKDKDTLFNQATALFIATAICYLGGITWFMFLTKTSLLPAISLVVLPFIPGDLIKITIALFLKQKIKLK